MKRFFFTTIALAAVAVGCTKSGLMESPQTYETPITFEPYTGKAPVTKATVVETGDLYDAGFRVIGFEQSCVSKDLEEGKDLFDNTDNYLDKKVYVGKTGSDYNMEDGKPVWTYDIAMYWPENKYLAFVAYGLNVGSDTDTNEDGKVDLDDSKSFVRGADYTTFTYTVSPTVADQKDLVISPLMVDKNNASGTIAVQLYHVLSRVGFKVLPSGTSDVNVVIKNINLTGKFVQSGTFDLMNAVTVSGTTKNYGVTNGTAATDAFSYSLFGDGYVFEAPEGKNYKGFLTESVGANATAVPVWNNYSFASGKTFNPGDTTPPTIATDNDGVPTDNTLKAAYKNRYMMIMPQEITGAQVEVIYHLSDDVERIATIPIGDAAGKFKFDAGKAYEFVFTISTTAVGFNVEVNTWNPAAGENVETELTPVA